MDNSFSIQGVLLYADERCLLSVTPAQLFVGWMVNCIKELIWFESVIKITCSAWVTVLCCLPAPALGIQKYWSQYYGQNAFFRVFSEIFTFADFMVWIRGLLDAGWSHLLLAALLLPLQKIWKSQTAIILEVVSLLPMVNSLWQFFL